MTLQQHLSTIGSFLVENEANDLETLTFQLYLLCLGKAGSRREKKLSLGFFYTDHDLLQEIIEPLWTLACNGTLSDAKSPMPAFFEDDDLDSLDEGAYGKQFNETLKKYVRSSVTQFDHMQPEDLSDLVVYLSGYSSGKTVYNPYAGIGSYACSFAAGDNYYGEESDRLTWAIGVFNLWMHDSDSYGDKISWMTRHTESANYTLGDSLKPIWNRQFDIIVSTPPLGRINAAQETFADDVITDTNTFLNHNGTLLLVTTMSQISGERGRRLLDSGLLDMVMTLPKGILYWTKVAPIVVRLKSARSAEDPIILADLSPFYSTYYKSITSIDILRIREIIESRDPFYIQEVDLEKINNNGGSLIPSDYLLHSDTDAIGRDVLPLRDLGVFLDLPKVQARIPVVEPSDLIRDGKDYIIKPHSMEKQWLEYKKLEQDAFLFFANHHGIRYGYVKASPDAPVAIESSLYAFVLDTSKCLEPFFIMQLPQAENTFTGRYAGFGVSQEELSLIRIHLFPIEKQQEIIKTEEIRFLEAAKAFMPEKEKRRTPIIALVGEPLPEIARSEYKILHTYSDGWEALREIPIMIKAIDAIVINNPQPNQIQEVVSLCNTLPAYVYILTDNPAGMVQTGNVRIPYEEFQQRIFPLGMENALCNSIQSKIFWADTPEGRIRNRYASQLNAIEKIERKFPELVNMQDTIQNIIISDLSKKDWINKFRTIRDKCLEILVRFGYVPQTRNNFDIGAITDLLADKVYKPSGTPYFYVILKNPLENDALAVFLKASKQLFNEQSHDLLSNSPELQESALQLLFALLKRISDMIDLKCFEQRRQGEALGYWDEVDYDDYDSYGTVIIGNVKNHGYYYCGNVHLDSSLCQSLGIKEGDRVRLTRKPVPESKPELANVWFYSKNFEKA